MSTGTYRKSRKLSKEAAAKVRAERASELAQLREALATFEASADPAFVAATLATHDGYSPRNAMLIAMQQPGATDVAGYGEWRERGRQVRKGEHGIRIMAPAGTYTTKGAEPAEDGEAGSEEHMRFRAISVFDVAQTDPASAPATVTSQEVDALV